MLLCRVCEATGSPNTERERIHILRRFSLMLLVAILFNVVSHSNYTLADDWPTFLGPYGDNKSTETGWQLNWEQQKPAIKWSYPLGESYGIGSVSRGRYFQFDRERRAEVAALLCLDAQTGKLEWDYRYASNYVDMYNYSSGPRTSPVIDGDRVYLLGVEGWLKCLDIKDRSVIWEVDTSKKFGVIQNFFGVGSTPVVYQDLLIVMVGGSPPDDQQLPPGQLDRVTGNGSGIVAFDKKTGEVRYQISNSLASYASPKIVQRPDRAWCFAFTRQGLLAFNPANGRQDFDFPWRAKILESVNASGPVVWDDRVFISETYGPGAALLRFGVEGHEEIWSDDQRSRKRSMQTHWNTPIYHDGYIYGSSGRHTNGAELRCIEAETGKVMWSEPGLTRASLLYVDQHFVCLSEDGILRVLRADPKKYDLVCEYQPVDVIGDPLLRYPAWSAPILSNGLLYVRGKDRVICLQLEKK